MKALHLFSGFVIFLIAVAAGIYLVLPDCPEICPVVSWVLGESLRRIAAGVAILVVAVVFAASAFKTGKKRRFISFESEGGSISVSVQAVTDYLSRIADEFAGIKHLEADIVSKEEPLDIRLNLKVKSGANIPELCALVQERVRNGLSANLGIADVKTVKINVMEIVGERENKNAEPSDRPDWQNI